MPGFMLNSQQVRTVLELAGLAEPVKGSPLQFLPPDERRLHPDDPVFIYLIEQSIIEPENDGWRVNKLFALALQACIQPEEVISIGIDRPGHPGFSLVRLGQLWCECTLNRDGVTKFYFPLSRSTLILALTDALSGDNPEAESAGFRFVGSAEDAFVLAAVMRELREYPVNLTVTQLRKAVARAAVTPGFAAPFTTTVGPEPIERLAESPEAIEASIGRLVLGGHVQVTNGNIEPSNAVATALGSYPEASFGITRTEITESGPASQSILVIRAGNRNLVFRELYKAGEDIHFEWVEMNRQQLRLMVTAILLPTSALEQLTDVVMPAPSTVAEMAPPPLLSETQARPAEPPQTPPVPSAATVVSPETVIFSSAPVFCTACGVRLKPGASFCTQCGARVKKEAQHD